MFAEFWAFPAVAKLEWWDEWDIDPGEDAAVIRTVIPIVKQADIPVGTDGIQEIQERAGALREFEAVEALVGNVW